jgi:hypothetical protein
VHGTVFPGAEPKKYEMEMVFPCALDERVDIGEIEFALLRLELFPIDGSFDGVGVEGGQAVPNLRQFGRPGGRIVDLPSEDEKGLAVDEEGPATVFLDEPGRFGGGEKGRGKKGGEKQRHEKAETEHVDHLGMNIFGQVKRFKWKSE